MTENEYRELLTFLFERFIRPRIARVRRRYRHPFGDGYAYYLDHAVRAGQLLRFVETYCHDNDEIYNTFTLEGLSGAVSETGGSLRFSIGLMEECGFLDACESHAQEIAEGLEAAYLPEVDKDFLRDMGSVNPEVELRTLVFAAKTSIHRNTQQPREVSIRQQLERSNERLEKQVAEFRKRAEAKNEGIEDVPKKTVRWFKALGQLVIGAGLSIENVALAAGYVHLPISPETQTWGAITSVTTGIGTILSGVGELRNE